jgi:cytochrome bd-type quinol oxidase subunit 2
VQRNLAGILFLVAGVMVSVALGAWWLQRNALTPESTSGRAAAIMQDDQIRAEITAVVTAATTLTVDRPPEELARFIDQVIGSRPGGAVVADIVADAHGRAIGNHEEPVRITGAQMVEIVRTQAVGDLAPVTLPVAEITPLRFLATTLGWVAAVSLVIGAIAFLLGVIVRPERGDVARGLAELCLSLAASLVLFGLLVPIFLLPAINDSTWMAAVPRLSIRTLPFVLGICVVLVAVGLLVLVRSWNTGKRKQWSTPLSVGRYREDRSWS